MADSSRVHSDKMAVNSLEHNKNTPVKKDTGDEFKEYNETSTKMKNLEGVPAAGLQPGIHNLQNNVPKKKSCFQITRVVDHVDDHDGDDLDETNTEDISSMDTSKTNDMNAYMADHHHDGRGYLSSDGDTVQTLDDESVAEEEVDEVKQEAMASNAIDPKEAVHEPIKTQDTQSRFRVVKIISTEPFKKGRWKCYDYLDEKAPSEKIEKPQIDDVGSGNSSAGSSVHYVHGSDDPSKNPLNSNIDTTPHKSHPAVEQQQTHALSDPQVHHIPPQNGNFDQTSKNQVSASTPHIQSSTNLKGQQLQGNTVPSQTGHMHILPQSQGSVPDCDQYSSSREALEQNDSAFMNGPSAPQGQSQIVKPNYEMGSVGHSMQSGDANIVEYNTQPSQSYDQSTDLNRMSSSHSQGTQNISSPNANAAGNENVYASKAGGPMSSTSSPNNDNLQNNEFVAQAERDKFIPENPEDTPAQALPEADQETDDSSLKNLGLTPPLLEMVSQTIHPTQGGEEGGASTVAIDNKIEQAMDLVKSHLMYAVREEVEVLKEQIKELLEKNTQLEYELNILKAAATPETLAKLQQPRHPQPPTSTS